MCMCMYYARYFVVIDSLLIHNLFISLTGFTNAINLRSLVFFGLLVGCLAIKLASAMGYKVI